MAPSKSLLVFRRSAANKIPSLAKIPRQVPACEIASIAYSTWYKRPTQTKSNEFVVEVFHKFPGKKYFTYLLVRRLWFGNHNDEPTPNEKKVIGKKFLKIHKFV